MTGDERRQRILGTALEVFIRYGYRRATMGDIAREVGMSRPALYLVFPSKEALCREAAEMALDASLGEIEAGLAAQSSLEARLRHVFEIWSVRSFELVARSPDAQEMMTASYDFMTDVLERASQRLARILAGVIRDAIAEPDDLRPSAEARARILIASAHGFKSEARDADDMRALVDDLVSIVAAGLQVKAGEQAP